MAAPIITPVATSDLPSGCAFASIARPDFGEPNYQIATARLPASSLTESSTSGIAAKRDKLPNMTQPCRNPVFILTASRSGSTLLRFILDTHPEIACPPETMITAACVPLLRSWDILEHAGEGHQRLVTEPPGLPPEAVDLVRDTLDRLFGRYLDRRGKPRWCDKSLDSVLAAQLLAEVYPEAKFVCLYRHCMDVVASGIEACPWGVSRFGFDPFVAQNPGNNVAAIANYWVEWATMLLAFEQSKPDRSYRLRYEDLAAAPEEEAAKLLEFLDAAPMPGITSACFGAAHEGDGPGDEKIWFTTRVSTETLGRGVKVPGDALPGALRAQVNEALAKLGYREVGPEWNNVPGPVDPRLPGTGPGTGPADGAMNGVPRANGNRPWRGLAAMTALGDRIREHEQHRQVVTELWPAVGGQTIKLVVADDDGFDDLTVRFPAVSENGAASASGSFTDEDAVATFIAEPSVWQEILDGHANMITDIRHGRLRCINRRDTHRVRSDEVHAIACLLGLAQVPLVRVG
jgi:hypothetical protein